MKRLLAIRWVTGTVVVLAVLALTLADTIVPIAAGSVEPGTYEFIHINLDESQSFVVEKDGGIKQLAIPSQEVKIITPFQVEEDGLTTVTLDLDADQSLVKTGPPEAEAGWLLTPLIAVDAID